MQIGRADGRAATGRAFPVSRLGPLFGLLALGGLAALAASAAVSVFGPPGPPPGLSAAASVAPVPQYLNDTTGKVLTFTIHNTGSTSIGAVEIARPAGWIVAACPDTPTGWTVKRSDKACRYRSASGSADDIPAGASWNDFQVRATTAAGTTDRVGTWRVTVSASNKFDAPSRLRPVAPEGPGLTTTAYSFQILDAAVGDAAIGSACPAASAANHSAETVSTVTIVVCGRNRTSAAATPVAGESALDGSFLTGPGSGFVSGSIPAGSGNVVLAKWNATIAGPGTGLSLEAEVGAAANITSPVTTLDDTCGAPGAGEDCVDNGGYESTAPPNNPPNAADDAATASEDGPTVNINVLANDTDPDAGDTLTVQSVTAPSNGGSVTNNGTDVTYDPDGAFESLSAGQSDIDTFTYTVSDGNGGTDTATVTVTIIGANDEPNAADDAADVSEDGPATAINVLANDTDPDAGDTLSVQAVDTTGTTGLVSITNGGADVTYDPNGQFESLNDGETATDTFTYTASDGNGGTDTATVTVTITGVTDGANNPPTANDDAATVGEDSTGTVVNVLANDTDPDAGDSLTVQAVDTTGTTGLVSITNGGADVTYDPNGQFEALNDGETATDTFTYTVSDGHGGTDTATVTVTITGVTDGANNPPTANDDAAGANEDGPAININVLANDTDPDAGDTLTVQSVTAPSNGGSVTNNGTDVTYNPNGAFESLAAGETATDTFTYTVSDGNGGSDTATVTVTITGANDAPDAVDDVDTASEDGPAITVNVLANDTDPDAGDTLAVQSVDTTGTLGNVANNGTNVTYDPNGQFESLNDGETATDTFTYTASDGNGGTDVAIVTVTITGVTDGGDDPPTANDDAATVNEDAGATAIDVLANDTDPDGGPMTISSASDPANGTIVLTGGTPGAHAGLTYQPDPQYCNDPPGTTPDTFTYTLNGGSTATVSVTVTCVNDVPSAIDDVATVSEDGPATVINVLANDTDIDGTLSVSAVDTTGTTGLVSITNGGADVTYDPNGQFESLNDGETATDTFTYTASDGNGGTDVAIVTVTITGVTDGVNNPPTAVDDAAGANEAGPAIGVDVLANDTDPDADVLAVTAVDTTGTLGNVANNGTNVTYDPAGQFESLAAGETATDTFTYTVSDGNGGTDTATVTVTITGANDAPSAVDDAETTDEDTAKAINVLANDTDADATNTLSVSVVTAPSNGGSVTNNGTDVTYDPNGAFDSLAPGETANDTFTYTASDGSGGTDTATVTVTITGVNDAPQDAGEAITATGNTPIEVALPAGAGQNIPKRVSATGNLLANALDPDDLESVLLVDTNTVTDPPHGTVSISADGWYTYTPDAGYTGADSFQYSVMDDGGALSAAQTVSVTVTSRVWYVRNTAAPGGDGRSATPFNTIAAADTAANATGDTIFVHRGDGTTTGLTTTQITLGSTGQRLIGEMKALIVDGVELYPAQAGGRPNIAAGVQMSGGCTVTGVQLTANAVAGILSGGGNNSGTIADVIISSNFGGITLSGTTGTWNISDVTVSSSLLDAVQLVSAGSVNFVSASTINVTATGGRAVVATGSSTALSGTIDSITASGAATNGIFLDDTTGALTIDDVSLTTTGTAISIDSANGITINNSGDADVSSAGTAVSVTTVTANPADMPDISLDQVSSSGGATGIALDDIGNGTFVAAGGTLANHTTASIDINGGSGDVTYPGAINNGTGLSIDITNRTGGTVALAGAVTDSVDLGGGINLDNNDGSTINLSGSLTLATTSLPAFVATNGGTVTASGAINTIVTTTGVGVNISNTGIGAADVTFRSVNVDGDDVAPVNGIFVNQTGTAGNFVITGTGAANTGGTVRDTAGNGIELIGTTGPSLNWMTVTSNLGNGIHGGNGAAGGLVTGATLANLVLTSNGNDTGTEDGILFQGLVGTATFSTLDVSASARHNVAVINNTGTLTSLTISGSAFHDNQPTGSNGLVLIADGTATMTVNVGTSTFTNNHTNGVLGQTLSAGTLTLNVQGGTYTNNFVGVEFTHASSGDLNGTFNGGTINNSGTGCSGNGSPCGAPVNIFISNQASSAVGSILSATITNNTINNGGSGNAPGIWAHTGTPVRGHARLLITGNNITNINERGIAVEGGGCIAPAICDATIDATIENNTITLASAGALDAVHFNVGTAGTAVGNNDTLSYCADVENNTLSSAGGDAVRLRHRSLTTIRLPGYAGTQFSTATVIAYLDARNPATADTFSAATSSAGGGFVNAGATCAIP